MTRGLRLVFLNTDFKRYLLNDINPDLINLYNFLKAQPDAVVHDACRFFSDKHNVEATYYALREEFNHTADEYYRAILFLYLNRHGYNGLCRYSLAGKFNVPFGRYKKPYFPEEEMKMAQLHRIRKERVLPLLRPSKGASRTPGRVK